MKSKYILPVVLVLVFALSRKPGLMPLNFSATYALCFCAGLCLPRKISWTLILAVVLATDLALSFGGFYNLPAGYSLLDFARDQGGNYMAYGLILWLGKILGGKKRGFFTLLGGGIVGAFLFYLISNTAAWLTMPNYGKSFAEWIRALTIGDPNYHPTTWEFFLRGTFLSGGIFTALFVSAMKAVEAMEESPVEKGEEAPEPVPEDAEAPLAPTPDDAPHPAA